MKRKMIILFLSLTAISLSVYHFVFSQNGMIEKNKIKEQIRIVESEIKAIESINSNLTKEISTLTEDEQVIEYLARKDLNMVFPGESIYREKSSEPPTYILESFKVSDKK